MLVAFGGSSATVEPGLGLAVGSFLHLKDIVQIIVIMVARVLD